MDDRRTNLVPVFILVGLMLLVSPLLLFAGCGSPITTRQSGSEATVVYATSTTGAVAASKTGEGVSSEARPAAGEAAYSSASDAAQTGGTLGSLTPSQHKVITNASLQIEVENGKFQTVFDQASLLADRYGGYILSAKSNASGGESIIRSGVVAIRVPSESLTQALSDASKLGKVTAQQLDSQDVTEEYVDLQARLKNAQAQEQAITSLLAQAESVEDALRVRDTLSVIQGEIEQLKGRIQYLDEHSSYATLTITVYENGTAIVATGQGWGFVQALKDAARALVRSINELIVFLGGALPVLIVLAVLAWIVYLVVRGLRRSQARARERAWAAAGYVPSGPIAGGQPAAVAASGSGQGTVQGAPGEQPASGREAGGTQQAGH